MEHLIKELFVVTNDKSKYITYNRLLRLSEKYGFNDHKMANELSNLKGVEFKRVNNFRERRFYGLKVKDGK